MSSFRLIPALMGHGRAGRAMLKALALVHIENPELPIAEPVILPRDLNAAAARVRELTSSGDKVIALIANPHGLHTPTLLALHDAGIYAALVEKPTAVTLEQVTALRALNIPVAIAHGYRMQWGIQKLKELIGPARIFAIEGKYWQSSAAAARGKTTVGWKDDTTLGGNFDVLLDLGTHYLDLCSFLLGASEWTGEIHLGYVNSNSEHRDTHLQVSLGTPTGVRIGGSISKTVHGAGNELEINVLTDRNAFTWKFADPDHLIIGENSTRRIISRTDPVTGSGLTPFHGAGWIDGYGAILQQLFTPNAKPTYPTLNEHLDLLENLFTRVKLIRT